MLLLRRLESCSYERIEAMKKILLNEITQIDERISKCEAEFDELAEKSYTVKLEKRHGSYDLHLIKLNRRY